MPPSKTPRALCVSIHDVAPQTWPQCEQWLAAIRAVAEIPLTLLVVPHYHRRAVCDPARYDRLLENRLVRGDELALHGFTHLDEAAPRAAYLDQFIRRVYTRNEGEFYAIDADESRRRIEQGLAWFRQRQWPVAGFVAPAWLLGAGAWHALREFPLRYTTTLSRFHLLQPPQAIRSPSLVYSPGNHWRRGFSYVRNGMLQCALRDTPLIRLGLHPPDIRHPGIVRHCQSIIEKLLVSREAMTKFAFAEFAAAYYAQKAGLN